MEKSLKDKYYEVKEYVDKVDFSKLWKGFKPLRFALYNQSECFFDGEYIEKTDNFIANTSINYNGEYIAIWNVMEEVDPIILASKMIHEMFHGFQMLNNESRFPNEIDALYNYQYNDENLSIKLEENKLLVKLLDSFNNDDYNKLLKYRSFRLNKYNYEYLYESKIEQIEGSANYVELRCLKQLDNNLYLDKLSSLKERILNKDNYLPIRILSYDIGALLINILNENNISFDDDFSDKPFSISLVENISNEDIEVNKSFTNEINNYYLNAESIINDAILKNEIIASGNFNILGVNVYNAIYYNNYIVSTFFVMYEDNGENKIEYGNFVIETNADHLASKIYKF